MPQVSAQKNKKNGNKTKDSADEEEAEVLNVESADEKEDDDAGQDEADVYVRLSAGDSRTTS